MSLLSLSCCVPLPQPDPTNFLIGQLAFYASSFAGCANANDGSNVTTGISLAPCACNQADGTCNCNAGLDACRVGWIYINGERGNLTYFSADMRQPPASCSLPPSQRDDNHPS